MTTATYETVMLSDGTLAAPYLDKDTGELCSYDVDNWQGCNTWAGDATDGSLVIWIDVDGDAIQLTEDQYKRLRALVLEDLPGQLAEIWKSKP